MAGLNANGEKRFAKLRQFRDLPQALLAKSILDSAGIDSFLGDANTIRLDWFWSNAIGGVKLWVREEDAREATTLLDQKTLGEFDVEGVGKYSRPKCPACGSFDVSFEELNRPVAYGSFFIGVPIPLKRRGWRCDACGRDWPQPVIESHPNEA